MCSSDLFCFFRLKHGCFRRQIECVQKAFGSNGEQNPDFIEIVCGLLVKLYGKSKYWACSPAQVMQNSVFRSQHPANPQLIVADVRRDGKDEMPSRKRREKELGSLIVEKYRRLKIPCAWNVGKEDLSAGRALGKLSESRQRH